MPSPIPVSRTKVLIPQRREEIISRQRLLDMLNELLDFKLVIVAAPAGYGKTSLIIDFIHHYQWPACWFALDTLDQDPQRFIAHFISSIQQRFKEFGLVPLDVLNHMAPEDLNLDFLVTSITNDIYEHITEHFIIVLDDYHLLKDNEFIGQFLSDFLQKAEDNVHLIINSRTLLTLPDLPLLVARSQVGGLSIEELAFNPEEIQQLYSKNFKKQIGEEDARQLAEQNEGWITGLLLTSQLTRGGIGSRQQIVRTSGVGLYEYLAEQVLEQQPLKLQRFLLRSSLLEEFNIEMCSRIIGKALAINADWGTLMESTLHHNVFVLPVGENQLWLRYHHLFRDFLQNRMQQQYPGEAKKIQLELAKYFAGKEDWEQVFNIYWRLNDEERLIALIEKIGSVFIANGRVKKLAEWLDTFSPQMITSRPTLFSLQASVLVNQGKTQQGLDLFNRVVDILQKENQPRLLVDNLIRRSSARRFLGDYGGSLDDAEKAIAFCKQQPDLELVKAEAMRAKGSNLYQQGKLNEALTWLNNSLKVYENHNRPQDVARLLVEVGAVNDTLGDYEKAEQAYTKSLKYWQSIGDSIWQANLLNNLGVLQHSIGDFDNSFSNLEKSLQYARVNGNLRMEGYSLASIGDLYRDLDAYKEAQDAFQKAMEIAQQIEDRFLVFYLKLAQGRVQIDLGNSRQAELLIKSSQGLARQSGSPYELNKYYLENALLQLAQGSYSRALNNLSTAGQFFKKEGHREDYARTELLLCVANFLEGNIEICTEILQDILDYIRQPQGQVSLFSSINEINPYIQKMVKHARIGLKVEIFNERAEEFQTRVAKNRRQIRKQASMVPFAPPKIIIRAFGKIEVIANHQVLTTSDWKTQTSRDLLFLFLSHPKGITKEEVGICFWPESSPGELKLRFKNGIYRLRHAMGTDVIIFDDNYYRFNNSLDYEYDVQIFVTNMSRTETEKNIETRKEFLKNSIEIYKGPYLPGIDADWVVADRKKYLDLYLDALQRLAGLYFSEKDYDSALEISQKAIQSDNCFENAYRLEMQAYHAMGNKAEVVRTYKKFCKILFAEIGAEPSVQTQVFYKNLMK